MALGWEEMDERRPQDPRSHRGTAAQSRARGGHVLFSESSSSSLLSSLRLRARMQTPGVCSAADGPRSVVIFISLTYPALFVRPRPAPKSSIRKLQAEASPQCHSTHFLRIICSRAGDSVDGCRRDRGHLPHSPPRGHQAPPTCCTASVTDSLRQDFF